MVIVILVLPFVSDISGQLPTENLTALFMGLLEKREFPFQHVLTLPFEKNFLQEKMSQLKAFS